VKPNNAESSLLHFSAQPFTTTLESNVVVTIF